jgi:hypothetical protein
MKAFDQILAGAAMVALLHRFCERNRQSTVNIGIA